jgi:hypothetical protein
MNIYDVNHYVIFDNRQEMIDYFVNYITVNNLKTRLRNILPNYTIEQNCKHHVIRIARECGFIVTIKDDKIFCDK